MRKFIGLLLVLAIAAPGWAWHGTNPFSGSSSDFNGFVLSVFDDDIDSASDFELVTSNAAFTQMSTDATISVFSTGASSTDTVLVHLRGIRPFATTRPADTLRYWTDYVKVAGGDTVATDSTFHAFESAWLDSTVSGASFTVFATGASPTATRLNTIADGLIHEPIAHRFFGRTDRPRIQSVQFVNTGDNAITYELRVYRGMERPIDYTKNYEVRAKAYIPSGGDPAVFDFGPDGFFVGGDSYIAVMAKGAASNSKGGVTIVGSRRWK